MTAYNLITCIVEKGKAEGIIEEAIKRGAGGATYFPARGKGVREKIGPLGMFIKEDKEVILIVAAEAQTRDLFDTVITMGALRERGKGFAFIQPVNDVAGFVK